jgi:membrane-associated phospholipid phosphatase
MACSAFLEVSLHHGAIDDWLTVCATLLSFLPWVVGAIIVLGSSRFERARALVPITLLVMLLNEVVLKSLLQQPRPATSCLKSKGMPSSHSALSLAWAGAIFIRGWNGSHRVLVLALVSVPWARVHVGDHTTYQVLAGCLVGSAVAAAEAVIISRKR